MYLRKILRSLGCALTNPVSGIPWHHPLGFGLAGVLLRSAPPASAFPCCFDTGAWDRWQNTPPVSRQGAGKTGRTLPFTCGGGAQTGPPGPAGRSWWQRAQERVELHTSRHPGLRLRRRMWRWRYGPDSWQKC